MKTDLSLFFPPRVVFPGGIFRRPWRRIFLTTTLVLSLAACGGETGGNSSSSGSSSSSTSSSTSSSSSSSSSSSGLPQDACAGAVNIARGLTATASSTDTTSAGLDAAKAFDGNTTTRWASGYSDNEWLAVNLGGTARICGFRLSWEAAFGSAYQIQTSTDGAAWNTVHTVTGGDGALDTITLATPVAGQHVRLLGSTRATTWGYSLWEFEVIGALAGLPVADFSVGGTTLLGSPVQFDARLSRDPGGSIVRYVWDFGDGTNQTSTTPNVAHTYSAAGTFSVTLTVTDNEGNTAAKTRSVRLIENVAAGEAKFAQLCVSCHAVGHDFVADTLATLTSTIDATMPLGDANACDATCAADIAAYILSWAPPVAVNCDAGEQPLQRSLRLLTKTEYQNTVNDLFNNLPALNTVAANFPGSARSEKTRDYDNNAVAESVGEARMNAFWDAAKTIATTVAQNNLNQIVGCTTDDTTCATSFVNSFGLKVFRRPLTSEERSAYVKLFSDGANFSDGAQRVIKGMLISPSFLYRSEQGTLQGNVYRLTPYETATFLSYTFTASTPDATLLTAAANNQLQTREQLVAQVQRLLLSPKATNAVLYFARQWLHVTGFKDVTKNTAVFPGFTSAVKDAMAVELDRFMSSVLLGTDTVYADLYVSDHTFANEALANFYGLSGGTADFDQVNSDGERGGILKLGAWLATQGKAGDTSPVLRGVFVRKHLLCQHMPSPPANLQINIPERKPGVSTREQFSQHSANAVCATCHQYIDDVGFGFDTFDGDGSARLDPDDYGVITGLNELSGSDYHAFKGVHELSGILAAADSAAACVVEQFQIFSTGQVAQDECTVHGIATRWKNRDYTFAELWSEIVSSPNFLIRR